MSVLASTALVDHTTGVVTINGVPLPFHVAKGGPEVEHDGWGVVRVNIPVLVYGTVTIHTSDDAPTYGSTLVIDGEFGEVGQYARELVRQGFMDAFPWLRLPEVAA